MNVHGFVGPVCLCVLIPSSVREGSTVLMIVGVQLFQIKLITVRMVSADANLKIYPHKQTTLNMELSKLHYTKVNNTILNYTTLNYTTLHVFIL